MKKLLNQCKFLYKRTTEPMNFGKTNKILYGYKNVITKTHFASLDENLTVEDAIKEINKVSG